MKNLLRRRAFLVALAAIFILPSCALPPGDAWKIIRHDGFITYLSIELGKKPVPSGPSATPQPASLAQQQPTVSVPWRATPNRYWNTNPTVETPSAPKPAPVVAVVPKPVLRTVAPKPVAAAESVRSTPPRVKPAPAPAASTKPELQKKPTPKVATAPTKPAPESNSSKPVPPSAPALPPPSLPVTAVVTELPYGDVIAGRPGFVHSPYAMKNQIVDVTGLRTGQEVKCPFTGKLFRVPPGEQAAAKPDEEKKP